MVNPDVLSELARKYTGLVLMFGEPGPIIQLPFTRVTEIPD